MNKNKYTTTENPMKQTLSLSIHSGCVPDPLSGIVLGKANLRAFLWNGPVAKHHDDMMWVAEFAHSNIFVLLAELKRSALEWAKHHGGLQVEGIHNPAECWPLESNLAPEPFEQLVWANHRHVVRCGGFKGLLCRVRRADQEYHAEVYDVLPLPPRSDDGSIGDYSYWSPNLFLAAAEIKAMVQASARRQGIPSVIGLDDAESCWVEGLGLSRLG